jgi:hypothetical protein
MKYKKVKMLYFDKTAQVKQLQDNLQKDPLNKGLLDRIQHFDSDDMYPMEGGTGYEILCKVTRGQHDYVLMLLYRFKIQNSQGTIL